MNYSNKKDRGLRLLRLYIRLNNGDLLKKNELSKEFGVSPKTVQRDIVDLREFLSEEYSSKTIIFHKDLHGYLLEDILNKEPVESDEEESLNQ